ncbi:hypothetical protein [Sulfurovum sp.]|uniref:hypothetical protein n=1 Tax=Sulfurovum sp. TaxID=1969726 RepID=UPI0025DA76E9|nr:hypothetical protein [Sulfurovum sp.]
MQNQIVNYLDRAMTQIRDLGLAPEKTQEAPVVAIIEKIADIDEAKSVAIARTLSQASVFNDVVRNEISQMNVGERYKEITDAFNSIRDDAKSMVEQVEDGKIDTFERIGNVWMKVTRGDIATRFEDIKKTYLDVAADSKDQIEREARILNAYQDFRGAIKEAEILSLDILKQAEALWNTAKGKLEQASEAVESYQGDDLAARAKLELTRDERLRELQGAEERYQIAKDLADNLSINYNTSEVIMTRLMQTTSIKKRVYQQAVTFFGTNETVLTALSASFTGLFGLHESTQTLEAMKEGVSKSLEDLADIGGKVQDAAIKAGYGPTIRAEAVKKLVDSVVNFQERTIEMVDEMRKLSQKNSEEIRDAVEEGKQRLSHIINRGSSLALPHKV